MTDEFEIDGVEFVVDYARPSTPERFSICKPIGLVDAYRGMLVRESPQTIVELGIARGGSAAMIALITQPRILSAFDIGDEVPALTTLIADRDLPIRARYGIDQADPQVSTTLDRDLDGAPLDLVIDDASHLLAETRASFQMLFPRLRPGGLYIIEDWAAQHLHAKIAAAIAAADPDGVKDHPRLDQLSRSLMVKERPAEPLSRLLMELILMRSTSGGVVSEVTVDGHWIAVRRGPAEIGALEEMTDWYADPFAQVGR